MFYFGMWSLPKKLPIFAIFKSGRLLVKMQADPKGYTMEEEWNKMWKASQPFTTKGISEWKSQQLMWYIHLKWSPRL